MNNKIRCNFCGTHKQTKEDKKYVKSSLNDVIICENCIKYYKEILSNLYNDKFRPDDSQRTD